jgi:NAD(P)-dependent dehydrogenase (short-subunit alcohol dehydrogenase family)
VSGNQYRSTIFEGNAMHGGLEGKRALVTAAGQGIGRATVEAFLRRVEGAVIGMTKAVATDHVASGIRCN